MAVSLPKDSADATMLDCRIQRIRYRAPDGVFIIASALPTQGPPETITLTGPIGDQLPHESSAIRCYGHWDTHPRYGRQFVTQAVTRQPPDSVAALQRYLTMARCPQLGPTTARRLVEAFGMRTLDVLRTAPDQVAALPRISQARAQAWQTFFYDHQAVETLVVWLLSLEVDPGLARRLYETFGAQAMDQILRNPYQLTTEHWGVSFPTADRIALAQDWPPLGRARLTALWQYTLQQRLLQGDCARTTADQMADALAFLTQSGSASDAAREALTALLPTMARHPDLTLDAATDRWALRRIDRLEWQLAQRLVAHRHQALPGRPVPPSGWLASTLGVANDPLQEHAILQALTHPVSVLTGGPGTGKTTITQGLLRWLTTAWQVPASAILLAAPTARAAGRLAQVTQHPAMTLHRLLGWQPEGFAHHAEAPLEGQWLVVDETSMMDLPLAAALWDAIPPTMQVLWIGDHHQLPSVGPGAVLRDMMTDPAMPVTVLQQNFRAHSGLATNAHRMLSGQLPESTEDFTWRVYPRGIDKQRVQTDLLRIVDRLTRHHPWQSIQILTPMHQGLLGTDALNPLLRDRWNPVHPTTPSFTGTRQRVFVPGDRVMHLHNDYARQIFNGDLGWVTACLPAEPGTTDQDPQPARLLVQFDDRPIQSYTAAETRWLQWAYASTIHKAQGAEYPIVIVLVFWDSYRLLYRNLLYTAMTRAQQRVVLLTEAGAWDHGLATLQTHARQTALGAYLRAAP